MAGRGETIVVGGQVDAARCWKAGCWHSVSVEDPLGLCPDCVAKLR